MAKNVLALKHFESPKEAGTYFRLVCLTGPTKGATFFLTGNRIVIGRSDKADIRINDAKASREHAELTKVGDKWMVTDLGSQNGIMVNDKKLTQGEVQEGDKVIVGQTVFKFAKVDVTDKSRKVKETEVTEEEEEKRSMIPFLILILIFVALFLFDDFQPKNSNQQSSKTVYAEPRNEYVQALEKRKAIEDKEIKERLNVIYQRGLREYREGNFFRAIHEFNLALIIAPGDAQAEFYLRKTKEELDTSIEAFVAKAQRDEDSLKYQSALVSYCAILRLLYSVPNDPRYQNGEKKIKDLEVQLGMEPGESNCIKKQRTN
jgi:pSer/pThr/pTyr-binding forkhead associated (FHA) protein